MEVVIVYERMNPKLLNSSFKGIQHMGKKWVKNLQTELLVELYATSLVRAIGKVFLMKLS